MKHAAPYSQPPVRALLGSPGLSWALPGSPGLSGKCLKLEMSEVGNA